MLFTCARQRRRPHPVEQSAHGLRRRRHRAVELQRGEAVIAQQARPLGAQGQDLRDQGAVVAVAARLAAPGPGRVGARAQFGHGAELQEGFDHRAGQGDDRDFGPTALGAAAQCGLQQPAGQARAHLRSLERQLPAGLVGKKVLAEARAQRRETLQDRAQPRLARSVEPGACAQEPAPGQVEDPAPLVVQRRVGRRPGLQPLDAREQPGIHLDRGPMQCGARRDLALDRLELWAGMGGSEGPEHRADTLEHAAGGFERVDRVGEIRRRGIGGDARDLGAMGGEGRLKGGQEVARRDPPERRQAKGRRPVREQGIGRGRAHRRRVRHGDPPP